MWTYDVEGVQFEKRIMMAHLQNTTHIAYRLLSKQPIRLELSPYVAFRLHEAPVSHPVSSPYMVQALGDHFEIAPGGDLPPLRLFLYGEGKAFTITPDLLTNVAYGLEQNRGYECCGDLWTPGYFRLQLAPEAPGTLVASTESWDTIGALNPVELPHAGRQRRKRLVESAKIMPPVGMAAELVLAADQFIITPAGRIEEAARARAAGDEVRTVIAGYHWFTDWGRDTMSASKGWRLHRRQRKRVTAPTLGITCATADRNVPGGTTEGLYHTTIHAGSSTRSIAPRHHGDRSPLRQLIPVKSSSSITARAAIRDRCRSGRRAVRQAPRVPLTCRRQFGDGW